MKILKLLGVLLVIVIGVTAILSMILPVSLKIRRSIVVNAKAGVVYDYLAQLGNFNKWSVWNQSDSSIRNTITGTDGALGAVNTWSGQPELSGEGSIRITELEINEEIEHHISFVSPRKQEADSEFKLAESNGETKVTWTFSLATPRPWNIFNFFSSLESDMGKDFENGLRNLKVAIEKKNNASQSPAYNVSPLNFPSTTYAIARQSMHKDSITSFYAAQLPRLYTAVMDAKASAGSPSGLIYTWNDAGTTIELAAAVPLSPDTRLANDSIQQVTIPGSKAVYVDYYGDYSGLSKAYDAIKKYLDANNLRKKTPVIEQYITDPQVEKDPSKWLTRVIFLVD